MLVFSPLTVYALWPRLGTNVMRLLRRQPAVELVVVNNATTEPAASAEPAVAAAPEPLAAPLPLAAPGLDDIRVASTAEFGPPAPPTAATNEPSTERDPPLRSVG